MTKIKIKDHKLLQIILKTSKKTLKIKKVYNLQSIKTQVKEIELQLFQD